MKDLLIRFPDRESAIAFGASIGCTDPDSEETAPYVAPLNLHVIGIHSYADPEDDSEDPAILTAPGWWVMVRGPEDYPIPSEIAALVVEPDPLNPAIPNRRWA